MPFNVPAITPAGVMHPYGGAAAPAGWLLCYGQAVSRTTYAALFAAIATAFGVGDGSTTFNLPDLRGRAPVGKDDMGGAAASRLTTAGGGVDGATLGAVGGAQNITLAIANLAAHNHSGGSATLAGGAGPASRLDGGGEVVNSTGSGTAHFNVAPAQVTTYIIKT